MASKLLKVFKTLAAIAALAGVYLAGRVSAKNELQPPVVEEPMTAVRPGMREDGLDIEQVMSDPNAYHEQINSVARDLKLRIAEKAYESPQDPGKKPEVLAAEAQVASADEDVADEAANDATAETEQLETAQLEADEAKGEEVSAQAAKQARDAADAGEDDRKPDDVA